MRLTTKRLLVFSMVLIALVPFFGQQTSSAAYDSVVYDNLKKSRDALLAQQTELQRAYDETAKQIDYLNGKLTRINAYLKQVSSSLKDVDDALAGH